MYLPPLVKYASVDEYLKHYQRVYCRCRIYTFVVVVSLWKKLDGSLKANFVTCYQADNSISKIRSLPKWSRSDYLSD